MIYLDNAATSWPKPESVYHEVGDFLRRAGANPGRGGHALARAASEMVESVRKDLAHFFNITDASQFVFTANATEALNLAIKGVLAKGGHVVTSSMEHNAVARPLFALQAAGSCQVSVVQADHEGMLKVDDVIKAVGPETRLIVLTHASNVTGGLLPIEEVGEFARQRGITFLVDASQTVGERPLDLNKLPVDLVAFPGHKALLGPTGTGALYIRKGCELEPLLQGGTGTHSELLEQPSEVPYRYESGTLNTSGIAGLGAALRYISEVGLEQISATIRELTRSFLEGCAQIPGLRILGPSSAEMRVGVVSIVADFLNPDELGYILDQVYGIAVRAGLHCAPLAHKTLGTFPAGAVRFSFSHFNTAEDVEQALQALREIAEQAGGY